MAIPIGKQFEFIQGGTGKRLICEVIENDVDSGNIKMQVLGSEDTFDCHVSEIGKVYKPFYGEEEKTVLISEGKKLKDIEYEIRQELKRCDYWGALPISRKQYDYLCQALKERRGDKSTSEFINLLFEEYPACVVTTMIFFIVFEYTNNEFWEPWSNRIGVDYSTNHASVEGNHMLETLEKFHMNKYEDDGFKFITPLICQAGIPDSNLDDIFYALTTAERFDAHELVAEFKGWRATYIKKPLERFVRLQEDSALNLIVLVHDVMLDGEVEDDETYEGRIFGQYVEWKEQNLNRKGVFKGKGAYQEEPILYMDEDKGLCVILPEYILKDEYCDYIKWAIETEDRKLFSIECEVFNDGNSKHSMKKVVPLSAEEKYEVRISDPDHLEGEKTLDEWEIDGLLDKGYILFGDNGKKRTDDMITFDGGTLIVSDTVPGVRFMDVFETEVILPNCNGIKAYSLIPEKSTACVAIGNTEQTIITLKKSIRASLCQGEYLFGSKESGYTYPIYTSEPAIRIEKEDGQVDGSISMVLRNRDTGVKKTIAINQIDDLINEGDSVTFKALSSFGVQNEYGRYSIKFYIKGLYKKEIEFAFIPDITYDEKPQTLWPNEKGTFLASGFRYKLPKNTSLEFSSRVNEVTEKDDDGFWHLVRTREPNEYIEGTITMTVSEERQLVMPFRKRIRNLQWMMWKEDDIETELSYGEGRLDIKQLSEDNWLLSFSMRQLQNSEECYISLETDEQEVLQQIKVRPSDKGKWHIGLRAFEASIEGKKLPLTVRFRQKADNEEHVFNLVEIYESVILRGLKIATFKRKLDEETIVPIQVLTWRPAPKGYNLQSLVIKSFADLEMEDVPIEKVRNKTTKEGKKIQYMAFEDKLPPGLYKVAYGEEDYFDFGFDEFEPPVLTYDNTFVVEQKILLDNFNQGNLSGILDAISASYRNEEMLEQIVRISSGKCYQGELDINEFRRVIVFAIYALKNPNGKCEKFILQLLKDLYKNLDESGKSQLFDTIIGVEIKEAVKKELIDFFGLYYVVTNAASQETIDKIMSIDTFLGTRSVMKCPRSQWVLHSLTASLGFDIMKEMTTKTPDGSIKVEPTYEMFGDTEYFYNMFDWESLLKMKNYKMPRIDLSKKPEDELIFWSDGFINLMIKWYFKGQGKHLELEKETEPIAADINRLSLSVKKTVGEDVKDYLDKTIGRELQNCKGFYQLIAYSVKAGMIYALHDFGKIELNKEELDLLNKFIDNMTIIFPELIKRDILMAELYLYLKEV